MITEFQILVIIAKRHNTLLYLSKNQIEGSKCECFLINLQIINPVLLIFIFLHAQVQVRKTREGIKVSLSELHITDNRLDRDTFLPFRVLLTYTYAQRKRYVAFTKLISLEKVTA